MRFQYINISILNLKYIVYLQIFCHQLYCKSLFFSHINSFNTKYVHDKLIFLNEEEILSPHNNVDFPHLYI